MKFEYILKDKLSTLGTIYKKVVTIEDIEEEYFQYNNLDGYEIIARRQALELKDKNGVEMYNGDIVKDGASSIGRLWEVSITPLYGVKFILVKDNKHRFSYNEFSKYHKDNFEVVGNIYEYKNNVELIYNIESKLGKT